VTNQTIKIGATYASKHETWGPVRYSHVTDDGSHIFTAIGSNSKAVAQFDETGRCVFYDRGFRTNPSTDMIEPIGYYRNSKPFLRRRVEVENEEVFDGVPVRETRLKTPQETANDISKLQSLNHLGAGIDYETSWPKNHVSYLNKSGMTREAK
jgi:hypothetical protein